MLVLVMMLVLLVGMGYEAEMVERASRDLKDQWGAMAYLMAGWQMARALMVAEDQAGGDDAAFMVAKATTARFYAEHILPRTGALRSAVVNGADSVTELALEAF